MKHTARLRLALYFAAAITSVALGTMAADEPGPDKAAPVPSSKPAQAPPTGTSRRRDTYPFRGVVASIDAEARTVTLEGRQNRRVIHLTELTRLEKEGQPAQFADLKAGDRVGGTLRKTGDGREQAVLIRLGLKRPAAGSTPADPNRDRRNERDAE